MTFTTAHFGPIAVDETSIIEFPEGLPGFEDRRRFVALQQPAHQGLVFLQSLEIAALCFLALPVLSVRPDYRLAMTPEDLKLLGFPEDHSPEIGSEVVALAILSLTEGEEPTVNLLSPVVIHTQTRRAVQAIRPDDRYGCREAPLREEVAVCS
ncbi:MAG: flagellar assembly protein FliW [Acidobacteriia bacterium]|nr:flagellar assembly protein FliW [Terriglobia bacterium]